MRVELLHALVAERYAATFTRRRRLMLITGIVLTGGIVIIVVGVVVVVVNAIIATFRAAEIRTARRRVAVDTDDRTCKIENPAPLLLLLLPRRRRAESVAA
jgi:hypothetical protein